MNRTVIEKALKELQPHIDQIQEPAIQGAVTGLLNLIEALATENEALQDENQKLKDEINRLKGEQGKPEIKGKNNKEDSQKDDAKNNRDISSENERKPRNNSDNNDENPNPKKRKRKRHPKLLNIAIDREEICPVDPSILPDDAVFKGYEDVVIQDIKIETDHVKYRREVYHSHSQQQSYSGQLPKGIEGKGEYGVGIRTLIPLLKAECHMSEPCILDFFENFGILISKTYISTQWTGGYANFHDEKEAIVRAGLESTTYQQIDDTGARVKGENHYTHILCNPYYSAFFTKPRKDRLTILDILMLDAPRQFLYNETTQAFLKETFQLSDKVCQAIEATFSMHETCDETAFEQRLNQITTAKIGPQIRTRIKEAFAIAFYWQQDAIPIVKILMSDDAPQFKKLTEQHILCWIHDGRHYKKLRPFVAQHQEALTDFREQYWTYYHQLKAYKENPCPEAKILLTCQFDALFASQAGYEDLDKRIEKTLAKKEELLLVLEYPELPLHNNASELSARVQVRHRDVSLHTKSEAGTKIKDTFMTITETAKKLGVRAYDYIHDRVSDRYQLPSLAEIISQKSKTEMALK